MSQSKMPYFRHTCNTLSKYLLNYYRNESAFNLQKSCSYIDRTKPECQGLLISYVVTSQNYYASISISKVNHSFYFILHLHDKIIILFSQRSIIFWNTVQMNWHFFKCAAFDSTYAAKMQLQSILQLLWIASRYWRLIRSINLLWNNWFHNNLFSIATKSPKMYNFNEKSFNSSTLMTIAHLSDFHYDPYYANGSSSDCIENICCRNTSIVSIQWTLSTKHRMIEIISIG